MSQSDIKRIPVAPLDGPAFRDRFGPWAVITGGTEGTGASFARLLAQVGINVVLVARRVELLDALDAELHARHGVEVRTLVQDLMEPDAAQKILDATADLDVGLFVSNAGVDGGPKRFLNQKAERWVRMINMNVANVTVAAHGFGNRLRARGRGGLLLMSSGAALVGQPYLALYSATKAFDLSLAEALWGEWAEWGIDVLAVLAPTMNTPLVMKGVEQGNVHFDIIYDCDDVAGQALAQLGHSPVLAFPSSATDLDPDKLVEGRRDLLLRTRDVGNRHLPTGGARPAGTGSAPS